MTEFEAGKFHGRTIGWLEGRMDFNSAMTVILMEALQEGLMDLNAVSFVLGRMAKESGKALPQEPTKGE